MYQVLEFSGYFKATEASDWNIALCARLIVTVQTCVVTHSSSLFTTSYLFGVTFVCTVINSVNYDDSGYIITRASKYPNLAGDLPIFDKIMKISWPPDLE